MLFCSFYITYTLVYYDLLVVVVVTPPAPPPINAVAVAITGLSSEY